MPRTDTDCSMAAILILAACLLAGEADDAAFDVAVIRFKQETPAPAAAWQGRGLAELISAALDGTPGVVAPRDKVRLAEMVTGLRPSRPRRIWHETGIGRMTLARFVLSGSLSATDAGVVVDCRLIRTSDREQTPLKRIEAVDIFAAAEQILKLLGEHIHSAKNARLPTRNARSLEAFCRAVSQEQPEARAESLEQALRADAAFAQALADLGIAQTRLGQYAKAQDTFGRLAAFDGWQGRAALLQGRVWQKLGDKAEAARLFEQATADPRVASQAIVRLGRLAEEDGELDKAREAYLKAFELDRFCAAASNSLGVLRVQQGQLERAVIYYRLAIAADPLWTAPLLNLASVCEELGHPSVAEANLRDALELSPDDPVIHQRLAGILSGQWRYGSAIRHAKRAVELAPDDAQARQTLGATYYHAKETEAARTELARALELDPELARAHFTIGLTYQLDGDLARAIDSYRRALGIDPDLAECREELGRAEARLRAERMQGRSTFGCAGTDAGAGSPEALAALMLLAGAPALALRGRMFLIRCVHGDRILQV